jgi:SPP1 gp7 family putative phage head morphogenesis protein
MPSKSSLNLSKTTRSNLMKAKSVEHEYFFALKALFQQFNDHAIQVLKEGRALSDSRSLEISPYDLNHIAEGLIVLANTDILRYVPKIINEYIPKAYGKGSTFADTWLLKAGVSMTVGPEGIWDKKVVTLLRTKNLTNLKGITEEMNKGITQSLAKGIVEGEGFPELAQRISDKVESIGIARAEVLARTEVQEAANLAAKTRYEQAGIEYAQWLTAKDDRVSEQDRPRDGIVFELAKGIDEGFLDGQGYRKNSDKPATIPPSHPRCRCAIVPKSEEMVRDMGLI